MLGTQCWVSVVLGWTPHPDTWQATVCCPDRTDTLEGFDVHYCCDSLDTGMQLTYIYTL